MLKIKGENKHVDGLVYLEEEDGEIYLRSEDKKGAIWNILIIQNDGGIALCGCLYTGLGFAVKDGYVIVKKDDM